jgi:membrane protease YdiL (CAAX protease family)
MSTTGTPEAPAAPTDPAPDGFARALRGFGPLGILSIVLVLLSGMLGPLRAAVPLLWAWRSRTPWSELGLARPRSWAWTIALGIAGGFAFKLAMKSIVMPLLGAPAENPAYQFLRGNTAALPPAMLAVTLGAGFGEELVFRGFLFERLRQPFGDRTRARVLIVLFTSLLFGVAHLPEQGLAGAEQATISGLVMGTIYIRTRNLWLPIVLHAAFDVIAVFIIYGGLESRIAHFFFR